MLKPRVALKLRRLRSGVDSGVLSCLGWRLGGGAGMFRGFGGALAAAGWYRTPEGSWTNTPVITESGITGLINED